MRSTASQKEATHLHIVRVTQRGIPYFITRFAVGIQVFKERHLNPSQNFLQPDGASQLGPEQRKLGKHQSGPTQMLSDCEPEQIILEMEGASPNMAVI